MRSAEDWKVGDLAERIADHALVRSGEVHAVTEMYRGGYLGFGGRIGGEWNPRGWRKVAALPATPPVGMETPEGVGMNPEKAIGATS